MIKKIAFIGATGMLGRPVAKELVAAGFEITALVRDADAARSKLSPNISLLQGDVRNANDLENLMTGKDAVYVNLNQKLGEKKDDYHVESQGLDTILLIAEKVRINRFAFLSSVVKNYQGMNGFQWWVFDMKNEAVQKIKESGIPYSIFFASTFMDNFRYNYRQGNKILLAGKSAHKMFFISGEDYGKQVARSFQVLTNENREYVVQGQVGYTQDEAAAEYIRHNKKEKLSISRAPIGLLKFLGYFSPKINYGYHIVEALNKYPEKFEAEKTWAELGTPTTTLQKYAEMG